MGITLISSKQQQQTAKKNPKSWYVEPGCLSKEGSVSNNAQS